MDETARKKALMMIPYGLFVVGAGNGEESIAFTVNWLSQASFSPPLLMVGIQKNSKGHEMIKASGAFVVNMIAKGQNHIAAKFFKAPRSAGNTIGGYPFRAGKTGGPILDDAPGFLECRVTDFIERGDHSIVIGEVVEAGISRHADPITMAETGWKYYK